MNADPTFLITELSAWRFLEHSVSVAVVRVDQSGRILAANRWALALIGEPLVGQLWDVMLLNFSGPTSFAEWVGNPARSRLLNVRSAAGHPQTLEMAVGREDDGTYVLFGEVNAAEQKRLGEEVLALNSELSDLSRELTRTNAELREVLGQKEALLKETHHRVKNNLALITSLMRVAAGRSPVDETKGVLKEMQERIHSVLVLNETLYKTQSYTRVELAEYVKRIATHVFQAQNSNTGEVRLVLDLEPVEVATSQAIPCGLIVNELLTNSLKHAFPGTRTGQVRVRLTAAGAAASLEVSDTGVGLPENFASKQSGSLGLQLVGDLARQLGGSLKVGPEATFAVTFTPRLI